jgi:hypothetical protein
MCVIIHLVLLINKHLNLCGQHVVSQQVHGAAQHVPPNVIVVHADPRVVVQLG